MGSKRLCHLHRQRRQRQRRGGGLIDVFGLPLMSEQTVVIAKSGTHGGLGGTILLEGDAVVDLPSSTVGNGTLDLAR